MSAWISVKDRLPPNAKYEDCKRYLIYCRRCIEFSYFCCDEWVSDPIWPNSSYDPTHWMPLPSPPIAITFSTHGGNQWNGSNLKIKNLRKNLIF